jgi:hypothetical protein
MHSMLPLQRFMPEALATILRKAPLSDEKVAFAWRTAVGASVDRVTTVTLDGATLRVRVRDPNWQREVERAAALICARLESLLGKGVVKGLDVTIND